MEHNPQTLSPQKRKGFASMTPERRRAVASRGGKEAHRKGTAHEWTSETAQLAGKKGRQVPRKGASKVEKAS